MDSVYWTTEWGIKEWERQQNNRWKYRMNKKFLKDMRAYIHHVLRDDTKTDSQRLHALAVTLIHDLNGIINEDKCFSPRVTGYSSQGKSHWSHSK